MRTTHFIFWWIFAKNDADPGEEEEEASDTNPFHLLKNKGEESPLKMQVVGVVLALMGSREIIILLSKKLRDGYVPFEA